LALQPKLVLAKPKGVKASNINDIEGRFEQKGVHTVCTNKDKQISF